MVRKLLLAAIIWMVSASPVWAENWVSVTTNDNGTEFFVDTDSIRKAKGFVYYWELTNYIEPSKQGTLSVKVYIKLNCDSLGRLVLKQEYYDSHMGKGKLLGSAGAYKEWNYYSSGSSGEEIVKQVCELPL